MQPFYITTPIYYVNDVPHIGHTYTTLAADTIARWKRLAGADVFFLTGTDEHGINIERRARDAGVPPQQWCDEIAPKWQALWKRLGISNDDFIRTTEPRHVRVAQELFQRAYERGAIYKGTYEGWYCPSCEAFYMEDELLPGGDGERLCPIHKRPVQWTAEENYLFRLSRYRDWILSKIEHDPQFIQPDTQRNEMLNLVRGGLRDLAVSRLSVKWGIPVPFDPSQTIYVWVEALMNYVTAIGYLDHRDRFNRFWPHAHHLMGRDITRFHAVIWPCFLEAVGLPPPKQVWAHGFWTVEGEKMSKTRGNFIDPIEEITALADASGADWDVAADAFRYTLLREVPFGQDGDYSHAALVHRFNADLANDYGNLLNRTAPLVDRHFAGEVPAPGAPEGPDGALRRAAEEVAGLAGDRIGRFDFTRGLAEIWRLLAAANKYIDEAAPWGAFRSGDKPRGGTILYNTLEALRVATIVLAPVLPAATQRVWDRLGIAAPLQAQTLDAARRWGGLPPGTRIRGGAPLFPRIERSPASTEIAPPAAPRSRPLPAAGSAEGRAPRKGKNGKTAAARSGRGGRDMDQITIDDFKKIDLRIAEILEAKRVTGADKLLELRIRIGESTRTLVAGIATEYAAEALVGRKIVVVANLQPRRLRGVESQGMLLAANDGDRAVLLAPDQDVPSGVRVS